VIAALVAMLLAAPDTLLVEVYAAETQERVLVEAVLTADSTLYLPSDPVARFLGVTFAAPWITPDDLRRAYPTVTVAWLPRESRVMILDPLRVLPASQRAHQAVVARSRPGFGVPVRSGLFTSVSADDRGAYLADVGYHFRGRATVWLRESSARGSAWAVTLAPSSALYVSYADAEDGPPALSGRVAAGPLWVSTRWSPDRWDADALLLAGRVAVFASTRETFAVTINAAPVGVQVGWTGQHTTARLTYGPVMPSPFTVPTVP
jgi:hypothetical protein